VHIKSLHVIIIYTYVTSRTDVAAQLQRSRCNAISTLTFTTRFDMCVHKLTTIASHENIK